MAILTELALAPALMAWFYIFIRDKYEKEPYYFLLVSAIYGIFITIVILLVQKRVEVFFVKDDGWRELISTAFITSSGVEEAIKFTFLYFLVWKNKNFNEPFDGIVYAVFISIGFAALENIIYVLNPVIGGVGTAISRAIFSVPGHGLFGCIMGFYFAEGKFYGNDELMLFKAYTHAWFAHAIYNAILLSGSKYYMIVFMPYFYWLWKNALKKMRIHLKNSPFK